MSLDVYNKKRDFNHTPEPRGEKSDLRKGGHAYVIQKHEASHLHYDFRLEVDGVLKSWAVPKGPSLNPGDKRLAMQTEDHPLDYGNFEGIIPAPGYGAGTVMLWDTGEWEPEGDEAKNLEKGKLDFSLHGKRLKGQWSLVRMHGRKTTGKEWLLIKRHDRYASEEDVTARYERSVTSRRAMQTIAREGAVLGNGTQKQDQKSAASSAEKAAGRRKSAAKSASDKQGITKSSRPGGGKNSTGKHRAETPKSAATGKGNNPRQPKPRGTRARVKDASAELTGVLAKDPDVTHGAMPEDVKPQLATLVPAVPESEDWLHEIKYDGYRLLVHKERSTRLLTRNHKDWTHKFADLAAAFDTLPPCILDGELVYLDRDGVSRFEGLQQALQAETTQSLILYLFDLIYFNGYDLRQAPQRERKQYLEAVVRLISHPAVRYSEHIEGRGEQVLRQACEHGLEGIISKEANGRYRSARSRQWLKIKCNRRQEFVVAGFTAGAGSRQGFGALLLGFYEGGRLMYAGKVGTGFDTQTLNSLRKELDAIKRKRSALSESITEPGAVWVKPLLVAEIEFTEWTSANRLRHPVFLGLRRDKDARDVVREVPEVFRRAGPPESAAQAQIEISHPDKVLYPRTGITKQELAEYYVKVAQHMLPYVAGRPLSLVRCPHGHTGHCFFQKHPSEGFGAAVQLVEIPEKSGSGTYAYVEDVAGLIELVQMGTLEIHAWGSSIRQLEKPDLLVFDLDPDEGVSWNEVKDSALYLKDVLEDLGLVSFLRTTGGKGLHLVVPVTRRQDWDDAKAFCKAVAEFAVTRQPERYIATASKAQRKNKIFIDYLRNGRGSTSVCSYSTRSRDGAPVAMPLRWPELKTLKSSQAFTVRTIDRRLSGLAADPWEGFFDLRQSITKRMWNKLG